MKRNKSITSLYKKADEVILKSGIIEEKTTNDTCKKIINDTYESYICDFGPTIITIGLVPALYSFYNKTSEKNNEPCQRKIVDMIAGMLDFADSSSLLSDIKKTTDKHVLHAWKTSVIDASAALKMIIRTYTLQKNE